MTTQCPICRSPVEVDDAKIGADGVKAQCSLCDEVFLVRPAAAAPPPANTASRDLAQKSSDKTSTGSGGSGSASRRILQEDSGDGAAPRVLVAHDSHSVADLMRTLLEEEGFDVEIVHDGDAAARSLTTNPPTVAILEAGLPKRFGFQLCADMRGKTDTQGVKFVLVASIYDRTRLGKSSSLANAPDDFVDPRNIETEIVPKVRKLARRAEGTGSRAASIAAAPAAVREPAPVATAPVAAPEVSRSEEIDFGELFEEGSMTSGTGNSGLPPRESSKPAARPDGPPPIFDVDEFLAEDKPPVAAAATPAAPPARAATKAPPRGADDDEREIWERVLAEEEAAEKANDDGDDLLKSLMEIAAKEPEASEPSVSRDRFPTAGPLDIPSRGPLPDSWKDTSGDEAAGETDGDALAAIVNASNGAELPSSMASSDGGMELGGMFEGGDDAFPTTSEQDEEQVVADADTLMNDGFSSGSDEDDEALLRAANAVSASNASSGTVPGEQREAPTVLKNGATGASASTGSAATAPLPAAKPHKDDVLSAADFAAELAGDSGADSFGDDDEKSLAEAKPFDARTGGSTLLGGSGKSGFGADDEEDAIDRLLTPEPGSAPRENPVEVKTSLNADPIETELSNGNDAIAGAAGDALLAIEHDKARRLAKLIVGDIVLYNADRIADAVRSGNFFEVMKGDIKDGRDFYEEKVPDVVRAERDHIQEILLEVIANKKKELGLS